MKRIAFGLYAGLIVVSAAAQLGIDQKYDEPEQWRGSERETPLPAFPRQENLVEFYVSAIASNRFFIDATSLSVSPDGLPLADAAEGVDALRRGKHQRAQ